MKLFATLALYLGLGLCSLAQENIWFDYQPLQSKGPVPADFTADVLKDLAESERKSKTAYNKRNDRYAAEDFYRESAYGIQSFLNSGRLLYGDTVTEYCRAVLDKILADHPKLRKELRLYVNRSPLHNAFTTQQGIIFVNTGLLSQLETEAQLAYVLAHEVVHYVENHVLDGYVENDRIRRGDSELESNTEQERIESASTYSKEHELEADKIGYERYFKNSGYYQDAPNELMDIMLYSYLPFNEIEFPKNFLNIASLNIPASLFNAELTGITAIEDYDDTESSHPNIKKRRQEMIGNTKGAKDGADFLLGEARFLHIRKLCRFENARLMVAYRDYERAIYQAYLLMLEEPNSKFLKKTIAKALYAYSAYANEDELERVAVATENVEGASQRINFFLKDRTKSELNVIAAAWIMALKREYPEDNYLKQAFERCMDGLVYENEYDYAYFSSESYEEALAKAKASTESDTTASRRRSKVANIKSSKVEGDNLMANDYLKYALSDFIADPEVKKAFEDREGEREVVQLIRGAKEDDNDDDLYDKNRSLNCRKVVILNPRYAKFDDYFDPEMAYEKTVAGRRHYEQLLIQMSRKNRLKFDIVNHENIKTRNADEYNHHAQMSMWLNERLAHVNVDVLVSEVDFIQSAVDHYDTPYMVYTGNIHFKNSLEAVIVGGIYNYSTLAIYPLIPYFAAVGFSSIPRNKSFNFYYVFDLRTGYALLTENIYTDLQDSDDYLKSLLYNHTLQTN